MYAFKISILSIHNKMNTVYAATLHIFLKSGGGVTIQMKIFHKPKRKKGKLLKDEKTQCHGGWE